MNPIFYTEGRNAIPSFTGPFRSMQELFDALIQKEKKFFEIHGVQELMETRRDQVTAENEVAELIKKLDSLQSKLSKVFDESIDQKLFVLIHGDFDAQNILVERSPVDNDIKIVSIIDWEFSRTGSLLELCDYPHWIYETKFGPYEVPSDKVLQENRENQDLRAYFRDKMVAIFGDKSGLLLDMNV